MMHRRARTPLPPLLGLALAGPWAAALLFSACDPPPSTPEADASDPLGTVSQRTDWTELGGTILAPPASNDADGDATTSPPAETDASEEDAGDAEMAPPPAREPVASPDEPQNAPDEAAPSDETVGSLDAEPSDRPADDASPPSDTTPWLETRGNQIVTVGGDAFRGRGANLHDTRGCNACTTRPPNADEVIRRVDALVDDWGANFIRLALESYGQPSVLNDASYLSDIRRIVDHIGTKPGVYVLLSLWIDPTFTSLGWPSDRTADVWAELATTFADAPHVLYGLVNEPQQNYDGSRDHEVWTAMNQTVARIRATEDALGARHHVITVQGTGGWARRLDYYVDNPISAGGGENIAYEVHVYDPASAFSRMVTEPAQTLPVVIGEFGPAGGMNLSDCDALMGLAESLGVPYLAWTFHMRCPPNLIQDDSNGGCGVDMDLRPTPWGERLKRRLERPWGS